MIQLSLDIFFIRAFNLSLPEIAVLCGTIEGQGLKIIYKKLRRTNDR